MLSVCGGYILFISRNIDQKKKQLAEAEVAEMAEAEMAEAEAG